MGTRIAVLGNAGSGKSTLSAKLAAAQGLPLHEVDRFMWQKGWAPVPKPDYDAQHAAILEQEEWLLDGMGHLGSMPLRLQRATHVILCDYPLWQNFWLLAERQAAWRQGLAENPPGGQDSPPPTAKLFETVWWIDREVMPQIREMVTAAEASATVHRIGSFEALQAFEFRL